MIKRYYVFSFQLKSEGEAPPPEEEVLDQLLFSAMKVKPGELFDVVDLVDEYWDDAYPSPPEEYLLHAGEQPPPPVIKKADSAVNNFESLFKVSKVEVATAAPLTPAQLNDLLYPNAEDPGSW